MTNCELPNRQFCNGNKSNVESRQARRILKKYEKLQAKIKKLDEKENKKKLV